MVQPKYQVLTISAADTLVLIGTSAYCRNFRSWT